MQFEDSREIAQTIGAEAFAVIDRAAPQCLLVDGGRRGWGHIAVTRSGAYDRAALVRANLLVGNAPDAAALEFVLGPLRLRFVAEATVALSGMPTRTTLHTGGDIREIDPHTPIHVLPDSELRVAVARRGLRGYLAVAGGLSATRHLGSASSDTLSGLGPPPLVAGDTLVRRTAGVAHGTTGGMATVASVPGEPQPEPTTSPDPLAVHLHPGPRVPWTPELVERLAHSTWRVSPHSDRVGLRLEGPELPVSADRGSSSEPLVRGAVQMPTPGRLVVMGPDHPVTGGYPVVAVVDPSDSDRLAQVRPGAVVILVPHRGA